MADQFPASEGYKLFENNKMESIQINDTLQGFLGDCWVLSMVAAIAEFPKRIWNIFETHEYNSAGVYSLRLYDMGVPVSIVIDDFLPIAGDGSLYSKANPGKETWPILLEKAFAKLHGTYKSIDGGDPIDAGWALLGAGGDRVYTQA